MAYLKTSKVQSSLDIFSTLQSKELFILLNSSMYFDVLLSTSFIWHFLAYIVFILFILFAIIDFQIFLLLFHSLPNICNSVMSLS